MAPRLIQDLLVDNITRPMLAKIAARSRFFFGILESFKNKLYQIGSIGGRSGKVALGSSAISNFWPSIVAGLSWENLKGSSHPPVRVAHMSQKKVYLVG